MNRRAINQSGFTIIETLIVLAIAGFIALIAFETIPVLTRAQRNNERQQDVAKILQATSSFMLRNSANFPNPNPPDNHTPLSKANLSLYDVAANEINYIQGRDPGYGPVVETNQVSVRQYAKCVVNPEDGTAVPTGADYRDIVALYALEGADGVVSRCQKL